MKEKRKKGKEQRPNGNGNRKGKGKEKTRNKKCFSFIISFWSSEFHFNIICFYYELMLMMNVDLEGQVVWGVSVWDEMRWDEIWESYFKSKKLIILILMW